MATLPFKPDSEQSHVIQQRRHPLVQDQLALNRLARDESNTARSKLPGERVLLHATLSRIHSKRREPPGVIRGQPRQIPEIDGDGFGVGIGQMDVNFVDPLLRFLQQYLHGKCHTGVRLRLRSLTGRGG